MTEERDDSSGVWRSPFAGRGRAPNVSREASVQLDALVADLSAAQSSGDRSVWRVLAAVDGAILLAAEDAELVVWLRLWREALVDAAAPTSRTRRQGSSAPPRDRSA